MANLYFASDKATKDEARKTLTEHVKSVCDHKTMVCFESDDGGSHIVIYVEVLVPSDPLPAFLRETLHHSKWLGWRQMVIKCPPGSIGTTIKIRD
jgi:hypothetical protein